MLLKPLERPGCFPAPRGPEIRHTWLIATSSKFENDSHYESPSLPCLVPTLSLAGCTSLQLTPGELWITCCVIVMLLLKLTAISAGCPRRLSTGAGRSDCPPTFTSTRRKSWSTSIIWAVRSMASTETSNTLLVVSLTIAILLLIFGTAFSGSLMRGSW